MQNGKKKSDQAAWNKVNKNGEYPVYKSFSTMSEFTCTCTCTTNMRLLLND